MEYNTLRPHSSLNSRPPTPETIEPKWPENTFVLLRTGTTYGGREGSRSKRYGGFKIG